MNEQLSIETPEQIDISFQKAGIGSRFYAALIDTGLLALILFVGYYVNRNFITELGSALGNWISAIGGILVFALFWGYYMVFEVTSNGQSLGKRALGLRVIKDGGYPVGFADSAIRNLVRLVDFLPFFYGAGLLTMLINGNWQRLGDLAAGTLVVKTARTALKPAGVRSKAEASALNISPQVFNYADWIQPALVTASDLRVIREYLTRRGTLSKLRRSELARTIADPIIKKMDDDRNMQDRIVLSYDKFLEEVYALKTSEANASG